MKELICFAVLVAGNFAAPIGCLPEIITVTNDWYQPPVPIAPNGYCDSTFVIPSDSYANLKISVTGQGPDDIIVINDRFESTFNLVAQSGNNEQSADINFPTNFEITTITGPTSVLKLEVTVTLRKLTTNADVQITTKANDQPTVIYIKDWAVGTSYTFVSNSSSSKVAVLVDPAFAYNNIDEEARLNNVFVYESGMSKGALSAANIYLSQGSQVTLNLAQQTNLRGAILVTDYENIKNFAKFNVQFVPVNQQDHTAFAPLDGNYNKQPYAGAVTIIGEKNGATPITIRKLDNFNGGGQFNYMYGGPVANYIGDASPITNSDLPRSLSGSLTTFILSKNHGNVKYTV